MIQFILTGCSAGYRGDGNQCSACPYGSYKDFDGAGECISCGAGANTTTDASTDASSCRKYSFLNCQNIAVNVKIHCQTTQIGIQRATLKSY